MIRAMQAALSKHPPTITHKVTAPAKIPPGEYVAKVTSVTQTPTGIEISSSVDASANEHPLLQRWAIKGMKLSPTRTSWLVALPTPYFMIIRQAGTTLANTRHFADLYTNVNSPQTQLCEITNHKPTTTILTPAFLFHDQTSAIKAVNQILPELV